jgi:hypothetical protein
MSEEPLPNPYLTRIIHETTSEEQASPVAANGACTFKIHSFQQFQ